MIRYGSSDPFGHLPHAPGVHIRVRFNSRLRKLLKADSKTPACVWPKRAWERPPVKVRLNVIVPPLSAEKRKKLHDFAHEKFHF
jgi:hypothetical protein